ncbi:MAG: MDR/zinc-dependent alcohol dehydrogenase-like family protein [Acidobacteriota bacterium]
MRALVIDSPGRIAPRDVPFQALPGECTVRVRMAGICGTDLQLLEGYAGFAGVPGHEFVGVVERVSDAGADEWIGRRVVGEINVGCGECGACRGGIREHCPSRTVLGIRGRSGAFAEYVSLPGANLHAVPVEMDDEVAVFAEPVAAACRILEQVPLTRSSRVAVLGDGRMGLIVAQVLKTVADDVTVIGRHPRKLAVAQALGLATARAESRDGPGIDPEEPNGQSAGLASDAATARQYDIVVDVTGRPEGLQRAMALARPRGVVVMKTTVHGEAPFRSWAAVVHEVTLVGSRCGPFAPAMALLRSGAVQVAPLITRVASLDECASAFETARAGLKVLLAIPS